MVYVTPIQEKEPTELFLQVPVVQRADRISYLAVNCYRVSKIDPLASFRSFDVWIALSSG